MALNVGFLDNVLKSNVVEIKFVRRHPKTGAALTRRALGTTDFRILNSDIGKTVFKFSPPTQRPAYNPTAHALSWYFDFFRLDWRSVSTESAVLVKLWPTTSPQLIEKFWIEFRDSISRMTPQQKIQFMDK